MGEQDSEMTFVCLAALVDSASHLETGTQIDAAPCLTVVSACSNEGGLHFACVALRLLVAAADAAACRAGAVPFLVRVLLGLAESSSPLDDHLSECMCQPSLRASEP